MIKRQFILAIVVAMAATVGCDDDSGAPPEDEPTELQQPSGDDEHQLDEEPVAEESTDEETTIDAAALPKLQTYGQLRNINLQDDYSPSVGLYEGLNGKPDTALNQAVGALGELSGEITVIDDTVYLGHAGDEPTFEQVGLDELDDELEATILFGAATNRWTEVDIGDARDLTSLQEHLQQWRDEQGVDGPLSFRISDSQSQVDWHVVDGQRIPEEGANSCEERKEFAHQFETKDEPVRIAGLFTTDHTGVVVDHTTSIHAHVVTDDGKNGHIDELELSNDAELKIAVH